MSNGTPTRDLRSPPPQRLWDERFMRAEQRYQEAAYDAVNFPGAAKLRQQIIKEKGPLPAWKAALWLLGVAIAIPILGLTVMIWGPLLVAYAVLEMAWDVARDPTHHVPIMNTDQARAYQAMRYGHHPRGCPRCGGNQPCPTHGL